MNIPAPVMRLAGKAGNWIIKNGPTIMSVVGGGMAVGGAVMACEATLHADEVLDRHKQKMARIQAAKELSDAKLESDEMVEVEDVYTEKQMKHDKAIVYTETARDFFQLYAPAVSIGLSGVALMQGAFWITERRRASAVAALTTVDQMYQNLLAKANDTDGFVTENNPTPRLKSADTAEDEETELVLDPNSKPDPFFFIFDETNPNWASGNGFLLNERFLTATIDSYNYRLSAHSVTHETVNDILKSWDMPQVDYGQFYGWNAATGDLIEYDIIPFIKVYEDDDDTEPLLLETSMDKLREMELNDIQSGYCIGVRLKSSSDGYDDITQPRFIYNEVYGN